MTLESGLCDRVRPDERLARFLRSGSHVAKSTGRIKAAAFLPAPDDDTSVFRSDGMESNEIRDLAAEHVEQATVHGTALVGANHVFDEDLEVVAVEPPPRHANIRGWPTAEKPDMQKNLRRLKAAAIADESEWLSP